MPSKKKSSKEKSKDKAMARRAARNSLGHPAMPIHVVSIRDTRTLSRHILLAGASIATLLMLTPGVHAKSMGGAWTPTPTAAAIAAAQSGSADAAAAARRSADALQRATRAIQATQAAQQAARDAAKAALQRMGGSGIPDGLDVNGLDPVLTPGQWIGGDPNGPTSVKVDGRTKVTVEQTQQRAIFTWNKFNVSENTDMVFNQLSAEWVALNRVIGSAPSQILGTVKAPGTVLVINQNGIIFGAGAQINVGSLIASTLEVGPALINNEAGNKVPTTIEWRNQNFLQNGLQGYEPSDTYNLAESATFTGIVTGIGQFGQYTFAPNNSTVEVKAGASITANDGGLILLTAPHVINGGHLSVPQGQVILTAAETALALTPSTGSGADPIPQSTKSQATGGESVWATSDKNIRGLVPLPQGQRDRTDYYVWNRDTGLIEAPQGNIYLRSPGNNNAQNGSGYTFDNGGGITIGSGMVRNDGVLSSTTSVSRNGSIFIDGDDIRLGAGSSIIILPDVSDETIPQSPDSIAGFKPSAIRIGRNASIIDMGRGFVPARAERRCAVRADRRGQSLQFLSNDHCQ